MKNFLVILTLFTVCFFSCKHQAVNEASVVTIRPSIKALVYDIAKDSVLKSSAVGDAGIRTEQWDRYENLNALATNEELKLLTDDSNSVVKCYAFEALSHRNDVDLYSILVKHLSDTASVETFFGCIQSSEKTGDYFLDVVNPKYFDSNSQKLSKYGKRLIDSILLFDRNIKLSARSNLLDDLKPDLRYHKRIREIATTENEPIAVFALAKFRDNSDVDIVKKFFQNEKTEYYAICAAKEFPEASLYPYLTTIFEKEWAEKLYDYPKWRILYQALARYPTQQTLALFQRTVQSKDKFRRQTLGENLFVAITKYPNEIYSPLMSKIKLDRDELQEASQDIISER